MNVRILFFFGACAGAVWAAQGCATSDVPVAGTTDGGVEAGPDDAALGGDGMMDAVGPCDIPHCSSDLHTLLDGCGNVLQVCPPNQGCSPEGKGSCIAPCDAAIANKTSLGCEYFTQKPFVAHGCWATFVANTWNAPITLSLDFDGTVLDATEVARIPVGTGASITYQPLPNGQLPPGEVAIVFMTSDVGSESASIMYPVCPSKAASDLIDPTQIEMPFQTRFGKAFHLTASAPVVAYGIHPYGGGGTHVTGSSLLLPTSAWGTNYIAVAPQAVGNNTAPPKLVLVAGEDNTMVTLKPTAGYPGQNGVMGGAKGVPVTYAMNKGQVLQIIKDLSGSPIQSNKNIAVFGAQDGLNIVNCCADDAFQQIPNVAALGNELVGVRYRGRNNIDTEPARWRIVGIADGTTITWTPAVPGAPTMLAQGQVVDFDAPGPFVGKTQDAQHPLYLAEYMTGGNGYMYEGDPEMVTVIPPSQWLDSYVFFTDPTYPETNLVFIREKMPMGKDITLDCYGPVDGWKPVNNTRFEYARIDLVRGNYVKQGNCDNGRHVATSAAPFSLAIWGWGTQAALPTLDTLDTSYGYPAGAGVRPINNVVVKPN